MLGQLMNIVKPKDNEVMEGQEKRALLSTSNLVSSRDTAANTVQAEFCKNGEEQQRATAFAMWPGDIEVNVPQDWKIGDKVPAHGPNGRIMFELPEDCQAGTVLRFRLKPAPELRIEVPTGASAGSSLTFERSDGTRISIPVPPGKQPGDLFEVAPPAMMVLVPEGVQPGDTVVFVMKIPQKSNTQWGQWPLVEALTGRNTERSYWLRAVVPKDLQLGKYFAARLPPPDAQQGNASNNQINSSSVAQGQVLTEATDPAIKTAIAAEESSGSSLEDENTPVLNTD